MKLQHNSEEVVLTRPEFDAIVRHLINFERMIKEFERQDAKGKIPLEWHFQWHNLKNFLKSEELEGSNVDHADGTYCCVYRDHHTHELKGCDEYHTWYIFAWLGCVAKGIALGEDATLTAGTCQSTQACHQFA